LVAGFPIVVYLGYDFWYRALTRKKPYHHPEKWPTGLIVYLALLFVGSIGLNWYGYLTSQLAGDTLVVMFFLMIAFYGYYQSLHNRRKRASLRVGDPERVNGP
jgi:uncharacterized membrane protein YfcA